MIQKILAHRNREHRTLLKSGAKVVQKNGTAKFWGSVGC